MRLEEQLVAGVAQELGLLDQEYHRLKQSMEETHYFSWFYLTGDGEMLEYFRTLIPRINATLSSKKYLLVVENLYEPIEPNAFTNRLGLPPAPGWSRSEWVVSATSREVCNMSKSEGDGVYESSPDDIMALILFALHQSAKHISKAVGQEDDVEHWHRVALRCFHYALLLFPQRHESPNADNNCIVTKEELIRQWAAQGFLTASKPPIRAVQENIHSKGIKHHDDVYQVGNIILQTFQEYSLLKLPFAPATKADEPTDTAAHFLAYHGLVIDHLTEDEMFHEEQCLQNKGWIKLVCEQTMEDQEWHMSGKCLTNKEESSGTTALVLSHFSHKPSLLNIIDNILPKLPCLSVLDLSYTPLESLPPSVWHLCNLRLLSLRGCTNLKSLYNFSNRGNTLSQNDKRHVNNLLYLDLTRLNINIFPCDLFQDMIKLEELLLAMCSNLEELPRSISALSSLLTLEISGTKLTSLPDWMFTGMQQLQSLKLIENKLLVSVPRSISKASCLNQLHILGCDELDEIEVFGGIGLKSVILSGNMQHWNLPKSLMEDASHGCLEELHIEGWDSSMQKEIKLDGHPTLKSFLLINAPHIRRLSLQGCRKLEHVYLRDLGALEELDLSATAIKELPPEIPNLPQLRRLLLMGVSSLSRFPWHKLQRFPDVFCLDCYTQGNSNHYEDQVGNTKKKFAHVCIEDSRLFYSFNRKTRMLVANGEYFQDFYVQIAPCKVNIRRLEDEQDMLANKLTELANKKSPYGDVYRHYMAKEFKVMSVAPPIRQTKSHVEMYATNRYPHGLSILLEVAKSISLTDDIYVSHLTDLSSLDKLEDCKLHLCHHMKHVFEHACYVGQSLRNVRVSQLKSLIRFYSPRGYVYNFDSLKHLHLEYCPRLESIMPSQSALPGLVTLDILFCYNLKAIFYQHDDDDETSISYQLPSLRRMRLQELPLLKHLRDDVDAIISAPVWKELHVRGCRSLRRLPRLRQEHPSQAVEVSGERAWWEKLIWDDDSSTMHRGSYQPKLPPPFASSNERAPVTSYIR
uniref:Disease resistance protein At4g27190-like leucine-rich repeats domain-containing protein n=1 Tax=Oryza punctata TaxID=4537 RepID=A0A0E0KQ32_ORYPU